MRISSPLPPHPGTLPTITPPVVPQANKLPAVSPPRPLDLAVPSAWFPWGYRGLIWEKDQPPLAVINNRVVAYIYVQDYYVALGKAIRATRDSLADFVYITGWELDLDTFVDPPGAGLRQTLRDVLSAAAQRKVEVLALLDSTQNAAANRKVAGEIAKMGGGAYLDHLHKLTGSQHQKLVVIRNSEGVVAFCGGCDLANHRLGRDGVRGNEKPEEIVFPKEMGSAPWHDVQVRVEGGAAADLWQDFVLRFREATSPPGPIEGHGPTALREPTSADAQRHVSNLDVQVVRTFPNLRKKHLGDSLFKSGYNFAPNGELTYYELLINALSHTSKTIYLEDQYMVESRDMSAFTAITTYIRQALERQSFEKMIILLAGTETVQVDLYQAGSRRAEFIQQLGPSAASKVATYVYKFDPNSPFWFHSKTWIFDDSFAVVGSANCNRRSYSCDSEIGVGVVDRTYTAEGRLNFAHRLRMDLWLKHLNALPKSGGASPYGVLKDNDISNFVSASALWDKAPLLRRVDFTDKPVPDIRLNQAFKNKYPNLTKAISHLEGLLSRDIEWDLIDPDAS